MPVDREARRDTRIGQIRQLVAGLSAALTLGVLLALLGPFGTFAVAELPERLYYWCGLSVASFLVYRLAAAIADRVSTKLSLRRGPTWIGATIVATLPMTLLVWVASFRHTPSFWPSATDFAEMYGHVLLIGAMFMALIWVGTVRPRPPGRDWDSPVQPIAAAPLALGGEAPQAPALLSRLSKRFEGPVLALQMEDHYVRVHGAATSELILMRLRDAIALLEGAPGL